MSLEVAVRDDRRVRVRVEREGVAWIEMIDAEGANALSPGFVAALLAAFEAVAADRAVKVAVLAGLPDVFCSGASADMIDGLVAGTVAPTELGLAKRLFALPVPVVAACEGAAVGGGLAVALACDLVVLADESRYGFNFLTLGFTPGMGTTALCEHVLSPAVAHELLYTGEFRRGRDLAANAVVPRAEVRARAFDLALRLAEKPREALVLLKRTLTLPRRRAVEEALTLESLMHEISFRSVG